MSPGFSADFSGFGMLERDLKRIGERIRQNEKAAVSAPAHEYARDVKRLAPVKTGQYRASIRVEMSQEGIHPIALIGTDMPQAKRLEFGFFDMTDSLGRHYYQYPRPHWRPAWDLNLPKYRDIMISILNGTPYGGLE